MRVEINNRGLVTVESATVSGLTATGAILFSVGEAGSFRIEVDAASLSRLHHMLDCHLNPDRSTPTNPQA